MSLEKLREKYATAARDPYADFTRMCGQGRLPVAPPDRERFMEVWQRIEEGHAAWLKLRPLLSEHQSFRVQRVTGGGLRISIDPAWGEQNGSLVWTMYELAEQAAPYLLALPH